MQETYWIEPQRCPAPVTRRRRSGEPTETAFSRYIHRSQQNRPQAADNVERD